MIINKKMMLKKEGAMDSNNLVANFAPNRQNLATQQQQRIRVKALDQAGENGD